MQNQERVSLQQRCILWAKKHPTQIIALIFWLVFLLGIRQYMQANDISFAELARQLADLLTNTGYGLLLFMLIYLLRPLILFPSSLLTLLAGNLFGVGWGFVYVMLAGTASSVPPYAVGRWFSSAEHTKDTPQDESGLRQFIGLLRDNPFQAVLTLRLLFLSYDGVSIFVGALGIGFVPFFLATLIGNISGVLAYVAAGASIEGDITRGEIHINPAIFGLSIVILIVSLLISRVLSKRHHTTQATLLDEESPLA